MNTWKSFGLCASLAAGIGLLGAGVVSYQELNVPGIAAAAPAADKGGYEKTALFGSAPDKDADSAGVTETVLGSTTENNTEDMSVKDVAANSMPAMVAITNTSVQSLEDYFGGGGFGGFGGFGEGQGIESVSMGTGIIVAETDDDIMIATNAHVVSGAKELSVAFVDESAAPAEIVGSDEADDLAVIKVSKKDVSEETQAQLKIIPIGSSDSLEVGESVVAIGNALGYGQSVSTGIVSALNRSMMMETEFPGQEEETTGMIQTDASINPGNSGGALLNMKGQLIGINSAKYADETVEGMGYAIPIDFANPILTKLANGTALTEDSQNPSDESGSRKDGGVYLGVSVATVTKEAAEAYGIPTGVYVSEVQPGSAASEAGIMEGDIITAIDDTKISSAEELKEALTHYSEGDSAEVSITREGENPFGQSGYESGSVTVTFGKDGRGGVEA
ncbi:MAG: trypsin-like peptidase domain-containing protein [Lachnospiraceae bacterium]|nr:trypsin-like peptidase domain-containing protein [Lachnospiraceae bacterium]